MRTVAGTCNALATSECKGHLAAMIDTSDIEWRVSEGQVPYPDALAFMEERAAAIRAGTASECIWLVEHPPLFTAGTSADPTELFNPAGFPVYDAGRGGRYTYHGPGQRVGYLMLDLERRGRDVRNLVCSLEGWMISTLADLGISAHRAPGRIGIWVGEGPAEAKIAALGIRIKRWVTLHGFAINVAPDLSHFGGIVPCGISEFGVTSMKALGKEMPLTRVDDALKRTFPSFVSDLSLTCKVS
ncbi:lipoyl(octanoyl) transferase LipB [Sphingomonas daechungensis]